MIIIQWGKVIFIVTVILSIIVITASIKHEVIINYIAPERAEAPVAEQPKEDDLIEQYHIPQPKPVEVIQEYKPGSSATKKEVDREESLEAIRERIIPSPDPRNYDESEIIKTLPIIDMAANIIDIEPPLLPGR